ncbi:unnamed protein product [Caenorhabditis bovis]|uniref:C6 domain-containing protein n=1 Tax=Caenorhabditis bovis TaxID=2654633 RepID=A0A8S1ESH8_9PELO|nr:unnamed protein product [Caenorhabditis bovis]
MLLRLITISTVIPTITACLATRTSVPTLANCPACNFASLSGSSFQQTDTEAAGTAYFLRGVDPVNWCDTAQINCLTDDGSSRTVRIDIIANGVRNAVGTGCGESHSIPNVLQCNSNNQWAFNGRTDFTIECRTIVASTCTP